jgi:hypothetical protein
MEVPVRLGKRLIFVGVLVIGFCASARAQNFRAGASIGMVNDVERHVSLDEFHHHDLNVWGEYVTDEKIALRVTLGSLKVKGSQGGDSVSLTPGAPPSQLPDLTDKINYGIFSADYEFFEGDYTTGIFLGVGVYRVKPESVDPTLLNYQDPSQTVFGWHAGLSGSFRIASRVSFILRATYHNTRATPARSLLTANAGFQYRF